MAGKCFSLWAVALSIASSIVVVGVSSFHRVVEALRLAIVSLVDPTVYQAEMMTLAQVSYDPRLSAAPAYARRRVERTGGKLERTPGLAFG